MAFQVEKTFHQASERVKSADFHPTQPWILLSLHSGDVRICNFQTQALVTSFNATNSPVRTAKFIPRKQWIVTGSDDGKIRIYHESTADLINQFPAHLDFVRSVCAHPTLPILLSAADDKVVKQWDWEQNWECVRVHDAHSHYVMQVALNPLDPDSFATASLDGSVRIWSLGSAAPEKSLQGHLKGVNCVGYLVGGDDDGEKKKVYLLSGSDDFSVKVWDVESGSCVRTLEGHTNNVSAVVKHPELPVFISASEDGTVILWDAKTFEAVEKLEYGMERVWAVGCKQGSKLVGFGCDKGTVMVDVKSF